MKTTPVITIDDGIEMKRRKFQYVMKYIYDGIYQKRGFYLLNDINDELFSKIRYFSLILTKPQIEYLKRIQNWKKYFEKGSKVLILSDPAYSQKWKELVNDFPVDESLLFNSVESPLSSTDHLLEAISEFNHLLQINFNSNIRVCFSDFGVGGSIQYTQDEIFFYLREDITEIDIFNVYVRQAVLRQMPNMGWSEYQAISKYITKNLKIVEKLAGHEIYQTKKRKLIEIPKLRKESNSNFAELGYPAKNQIESTNLEIKINNQPISMITKNQYKMMKYFIDSKGSIITPFEIGDLIWGKESEEFSLQAVNKQIQRLRILLKEAGLKKEVIHNVRSKGYFFSE